eukprot:11990054-Alexandrium_andersonii.AAC.1
MQHSVFAWPRPRNPESGKAQSTPKAQPNPPCSASSPPARFISHFSCRTPATLSPPAPSQNPQQSTSCTNRQQQRQCLLDIYSRGGVHAKLRVVFSGAPERGAPRARALRLRRIVLERRRQHSNIKPDPNQAFQMALMRCSVRGLDFRDLI